MSDPKAKQSKTKANSKTPLKTASPNRRALKILLGFFIVCALGGVGCLYLYDQVLPAKFAKAGTNDAPIVFEIPAGAGVNQIAENLQKAGLIKHAILFRIKGKLATSSAPLKAGEYTIPANASINDIFNQMQQGKVIQHAITLAEGLTSRAILDELKSNTWLRGKIDVVPAEGSLLPETYYVVRGTSRQALLWRMQGDQERVFAKLWSERAPNLPFSTLRDAVILASIVEKETGLSAEQGRVAAVFVNRLRKGMRLESDPTILYGLNGGKALGRGLRRSEIDRKNAWNTYQIDGLPPTPICNPGRGAMHAILHPTKTRDLYFVADGSGGHAFAKTYMAHLVNVAKWRKVERARRRAKGKSK